MHRKAARAAGMSVELSQGQSTSILNATGISVSVRYSRRKPSPSRVKGTGAPLSSAVTPRMMPWKLVGLPGSCSPRERIKYFPSALAFWFGLGRLKEEM